MKKKEDCVAKIVKWPKYKNWPEFIEIWPYIEEKK